MEAEVGAIPVHNATVRKSVETRVAAIRSIRDDWPVDHILTCRIMASTATLAC